MAQTILFSYGFQISDFRWFSLKLKTNFSETLEIRFFGQKVVPQIFERWYSNRIIEANVQVGSDFYVF